METYTFLMEDLSMKIKAWLTVLVLVWIITWVSYFASPKEVQPCYPIENTCGATTSVDDMQCQDTYFEKRFICMTNEYSMRNEQAKKEVAELSGMFANLKIAEKNLQELRKTKTSLYYTAPKVFPSELENSQN